MKLWLLEFFIINLLWTSQHPAILHNNIILSRYDVSPNFLIEKVITQLMACQGFPRLLAPSTTIFLIFRVSVFVQLSATNNPQNRSAINLITPWPLHPFSPKHFPPKLFRLTVPCLNSSPWNPPKKTGYNHFHWQCHCSCLVHTRPP